MKANAIYSRLPAIILAGLVCGAVAAAAAGISIPVSTWDGGGGDATGARFKLSGTIGQPDAGQSAVGTYSQQGGFVPAFTLPVTPTLSVNHVGSTFTFTWPNLCTGFVLEESTDVNAPVWLSQGSGTLVGANRQITVVSPTQSAFFRLRKTCPGCSDNAPAGNRPVTVDAISDFGACGVEAQSFGNMTAGSAVLTLTGAGLPLRVGSGVGIAGAGPTDAVSAHYFPAPTLRARVVGLNGNVVTLDRAAVVSVMDAVISVDDSLPIQAALDYVATRSSAAAPGIVYVRGAVHVIGSPGAKDNQPLYIPDHVTLVGCGRDRTAIKICDRACQIPAGLRSSQRFANFEHGVFRYPMATAIVNQKNILYNGGQMFSSATVPSNPPNQGGGVTDCTIDCNGFKQVAVALGNTSGSQPGVQGYELAEPRAAGAVSGQLLIGPVPTDPLKNGHLYYVASAYVNAAGHETSDSPVGWHSFETPNDGKHYQITYMARTAPVGALSMNLYVIDFSDANYGTAGWIWDDPVTGETAQSRGLKNLCVWTKTSMLVPAPNTPIIINHYTPAPAVPENRPPGGLYAQRFLGFTSQTASSGLFLDNSVAFRAQRLIVKDAIVDGILLGAPGLSGVTLPAHDQSDGLFEDIIVDNCGRDGVAITGSAHENQYTRLTTSNCDWTFAIEVDVGRGNCENQTYTECVFRGSHEGSQFMIASFERSPARNLRFNRCTFDKSRCVMTGGGELTVFYDDCDWEDTSDAAIRSNALNCTIDVRSSRFTRCGKWHAPPPDNFTGESPLGVILLSNFGAYDPNNPLHFTQATFTDCDVYQVDVPGNPIPGEQYQYAAILELGCKLRLHEVRFHTESYRARLAVQDRDYLLDNVTGNIVVVPGG